MQLETVNRQTLVTATVEQGIGVITLDHPPLNIITCAVLDALCDCLDRLSRESDMRVLLLSSSGKHFSAGADVSEHLPPHDRGMIARFMETVRELLNFPLPLVAAVRGRCLGGGFELVQTADIILAGESTQFGQPEIVLGVTAPAACVLLPELCPPGVAARLLFTGESLGAREALDAGFVARVVSDESLHREARNLCDNIARHSAAALQLTKRSLRLGTTARRSDTLRASEALYRDEVMKTEDAPEGLRAFLEKRSPSWKHR